MKYWWVNHKQTYKQELGGFYIWSPKQNRDKSRNQSYENLTLAQNNDVIFSYANGRIMAVGIVVQSVKDSPRPPEFGSLGNQWDEKGWLVEVDWTLLDSPFSPKDNIDQIAPLLPEKYSPIRSNGNGNQGIYLAEINSTLGKFLLEKSGIHNQILDQIESINVRLAEDRIKKQILEQEIPETEKEQLVKSRIGQGVFRKSVEEIESQCRITGIKDKRFLIASHIKPWRDSDNTERLDGNNGLLLSPHVDKLFDSGWISFSDEGDLIIADESIINILESWGIDLNMNVGIFNSNQKRYLKFHRKEILKKIL